MPQVPYRNYALALLTLIMVFNYVDRLAMGVMLQDIKTTLFLSDTQLGLLTGIAFAAFYAIMGIPIARWADRGNRVTIISLAVAVWSGAVALCGTAGSFTQLLHWGSGLPSAGLLPDRRLLFPVRTAPGHHSVHVGVAAGPAHR
jgi:predicted MFS family arabinose efflux permease